MGLWDKGGRRNAPDEAADTVQRHALIEQYMDSLSLGDLLRFFYYEGLAAFKAAA